MLQENRQKLVNAGESKNVHYMKTRPGNPRLTRLFFGPGDDFTTLSLHRFDAKEVPFYKIFEVEVGPKIGFWSIHRPKIFAVKLRRDW